MVASTVINATYKLTAASVFISETYEYTVSIVYILLRLDLGLSLTTKPLKTALVSPCKPQISLNIQEHKRKYGYLGSNDIYITS